MKHKQLTCPDCKQKSTQGTGVPYFRCAHYTYEQVEKSLKPKSIHYKTGDIVRQTGDNFLMKLTVSKNGVRFSPADDCHFIIYYWKHLWPHIDVQKMFDDQHIIKTKIKTTKNKWVVIGEKS